MTQKTAQETFQATGKRKEAVARVRMVSGEGKILVNSKPFHEYFPVRRLQLEVEEPFVVTETKGRYNVIAHVGGGGVTGQAGAVRLGISRALILLNENLRPVLRKAGFLTRDPREKERKKYGRKRARKRFQFSKR